MVDAPFLEAPLPRLQVLDSGDLQREVVRVITMPDSGWRIRVRRKVSAPTSEWTSNPITSAYQATLVCRSLTVKLTWWNPVMAGMSQSSQAAMRSPIELTPGPSGARTRFPTCRSEYALAWS